MTTLQQKMCAAFGPGTTLGRRPYTCADCGASPVVYFKANTVGRVAMGDGEVSCFECAKDGYKYTCPGRNGKGCPGGYFMGMTQSSSFKNRKLTCYRCGLERAEKDVDIDGEM